MMSNFNPIYLEQVGSFCDQTWAQTQQKTFFRLYKLEVHLFSFVFWDDSKKVRLI